MFIFTAFTLTSVFADAQESEKDDKKEDKKDAKKDAKKEEKKDAKKEEKKDAKAKKLSQHHSSKHHKNSNSKLGMVQVASDPIYPSTGKPKGYYEKFINKRIV